MFGIDALSEVSISGLPGSSVSLSANGFTATKGAAFFPFTILFAKGASITKGSSSFSFSSFLFGKGASITKGSGTFLGNILVGLFARGLSATRGTGLLSSVFSILGQGATKTFGKSLLLNAAFLFGFGKTQSTGALALTAVQTTAQVSVKQRPFKTAISDLSGIDLVFEAIYNTTVTNSTVIIYFTENPNGTTYTTSIFMLPSSTTDYIGVWRGNPRAGTIIYWSVITSDYQVASGQLTAGWTNP